MKIEFDGVNGKCCHECVDNPPTVLLEVGISGPIKLCDQCWEQLVGLLQGKHIEQLEDKVQGLQEEKNDL